MKGSKTIIRNGLKYEEDKALQDFWENGEFNRMIKIDPNIKPWEENYPYSREIWEFEADKNRIIASRVIDHQRLVIRYIAEGSFEYSKSNILSGGTINGYHRFIKGVDGSNFYSETNFTFKKPIPIIVADWDYIEEIVGNKEIFTGGEILDIVEPINTRIKSDYATGSWEQKPFGNDFIKNKLPPGNIFKMSSKSKYKKGNADKITNFNPLTDTLEIDIESFGIDSSATFATGKNKRVVKKKLAKQDFHFLYDEKNGGLYFNENGADKGFGDGGIIAILKGAPDLSGDNLEFI